MGTRRSEVVDYRDRQTEKSRRPMPPAFYAMNLCPAGDLPPNAGEGWKSPRPFFRPSPFCRFRFALMVDQFLGLHFREGDRLAEPLPIVGISSEGGGSTQCNVE